MVTRAEERGAARARHLRRLERRNIYGAAENPYKSPAKRAEWERGFLRSYYNR
jgi:hypothetical protein